jgi:hypothetical protein
MVSKPMKRTILALLLTPLFSSCETARNGDGEPQVASTTTTTTETRVYPDTAANPPLASYPIQPPPPPQTQRQIVTDEPRPPAQGEAGPTAIPHVARSENQTPTHPTNSTAARTTSSQITTTDIPYGKPVPGKPGYVFSPFDKNGGYVDVTGYTPGQKVKDPYTGKIFLVP